MRVVLRRGTAIQVAGAGDGSVKENMGVGGIAPFALGVWLWMAAAVGGREGRREGCVLYGVVAGDLLCGYLLR
jgi:hypothetical protein